MESCLDFEILNAHDKVSGVDHLDLWTFADNCRLTSHSQKKRKEKRKKLSKKHTVVVVYLNQLLGARSTQKLVKIHNKWF